MKLDTVDLDGPVHYADFGGSGEPMVLVHGLGGSLANWLRVAAPMADRHRVLALDLAGFGRTPLAGRKASVRSNTELVARFIERVAGGRAIVAGNSMGGLIATVLAATRPALVSRLILVNAALPVPLGTPVDRRFATVFGIYVTPVVGRLFLDWHATKVSPEKALHDMLRLCGIDVSTVPPEVMEAHVAVARDRRAMPWAHDALVTAARSIAGTVLRRRRFQEMVRAIQAPTLMMQGTRDRLVPFAAAQRLAQLRPDFRFEVLDGAGHVPQIQIPDRWLAIVRGWLDSARS